MKMDRLSGSDLKTSQRPENSLALICFLKPFLDFTSLVSVLLTDVAATETKHMQLPWVIDVQR